MRRDGWMFALLGAAIGLLSSAAAWSGTCDATSGETRAALVELYTSEGCSSCPPADRALTRLGASSDARLGVAPDVRVVPIALHVDYWDSIGWKDPFAQAPFSERQAWEVHANGHRTSFTPHFFVNGRELGDWRGDLATAIGAKSAASGSARLDIRADVQSPHALRIRVDERTVRAIDGPLQLFVAVTEDRLASQVSAGENRGARLEHDHVVRRWIGPVAIDGTQATVERVVDVPQLANGQVAVVAFVQNARTAEVVQAVATGPCKPG